MPGFCLSATIDLSVRKYTDDAAIGVQRRGACTYAVGGGITTTIKHAIKLTIKLKTSPARLAQQLQPSLAFCFSLQPMTAYRPGQDATPSLAAS